MSNLNAKIYLSSGDHITRFVNQEGSRLFQKYPFLTFLGKTLDENNKFTLFVGMTSMDYKNVIENDEEFQLFSPFEIKVMQHPKKM
jgi:hypothetical protein